MVQLPGQFWRSRIREGTVVADGATLPDRHTCCAVTLRRQSPHYNQVCEAASRRYWAPERPGGAELLLTSSPSMQLQERDCPAVAYYTLQELDCC